MHVGPTGGNQMKSLTDAQDESCELISAIELIEDQTEPEKFQKTLRIKSFKAFEWLQAERTVYDLLTCILATQMLEKVMFTFFKWHKQEAWLTLETAPLVRMANMNTSPAVEAVREIANMMVTSAIQFETGRLPLNDLVEGAIQCCFFLELNFLKFQNLLDAVRFVILVFNN